MGGTYAAFPQPGVLPTRGQEFSSRPVLVPLMNLVSKLWALLSGPGGLRKTTKKKAWPPRTSQGLPGKVLRASGKVFGRVFFGGGAGVLQSRGCVISAWDVGRTFGIMALGSAGRPGRGPGRGAGRLCWVRGLSGAFQNTQPPRLRSSRSSFRPLSSAYTNEDGPKRLLRLLQTSFRLSGPSASTNEKCCSN